MVVDGTVYRFGKICNVPGRLTERALAGELYGMRVRMVRLCSAWPFQSRSVDRQLQCRAAVRSYMLTRRMLRRLYGRDAITPGLRVPRRPR